MDVALRLNGLKFITNKTQSHPFLRENGISRQNQRDYQVFAIFNDTTEIGDIWEIYSLIVNAYISSKTNFTLCGFEEDEALVDDNIVSLTDHERQWIDSEGRASFRYWVKDKQDLVYLKIHKKMTSIIQ